jgi:hypothetical protein
MAFGTWFVNKPNAFTYIECTLESHSKKYGIKNSIVNATNVVAIYANNHINFNYLLAKLIIL